MRFDLVVLQKICIFVGRIQYHNDMYSSEYIFRIGKNTFIS